MTAAQSIPSGVNTAILLDTKRYDRRIDCSTVTGFFTCRTTGIHQFSANCRLNLGAVTLTGEAYIEIFNSTNGLSYRAGFSQGTSASPNLFYYAHFSTNLSLTKGDVIQLRVRQNSGSATVISNVESNTFFMGSTLQ